MTTNINDAHRATLGAIVAPQGRLAAFSAFFDGEPVALLVDVVEGDGEFYTYPLAILLPDDNSGLMDRITDHEGTKPTPEASKKENNHE